MVKVGLRSFAMLVILWSFLVQGVLAQTADHTLEEITVSDKSVEPITSPYAVPESAKLATEVITAEEIEQLHPRTVYDILEYIPGMEITFQGREHLNFANMRGISNFGIILDGVYVLSADRILDTIPVEAIESVRVVRDATALTLGPLTNFGNSTGSSNQGFVVIRTKRARKLEGGAIASYGSFHTDKEHVYQGAKISDFDYRVAYTHRNSLGNTNWYNAYRDQSVLFRGGYGNKAIDMDILYFTSRGMRELQRGEIGDGSYKDGRLDTSLWKFNPLQSDMFSINLSKPWDAWQTSTLNFSYNALRLTKEAAVYPKTFVITPTDQDTNGYMVDFRHTAVFNNNALKVGGQMLSSVSPTGLAPSVGKRTDEQMYSSYLWDEYRMFGNKLSVDGGIRMDKKYYADSPVTGAPMKEWAKAVYTYAAGVAYKPMPIYTITGRFAYSENTMAGYQVAPTTFTSLPPERRYRYEGGVLANFHTTFNPWVTLFYYDTKNQKTSAGTYIDPTTQEEFQLVTASDVKAKGVEVGSSGSITKGFAYHLIYSYVQTDNHSTNLQIAHHTASARFAYKYKAFDANLNMRYVGPHSQSVSPMGTLWYEMGDYTRVDANVGYNFRLFERPTKVMIFGQNLGDVHYTTRYVSGAYKDPGRFLGVQMSYSFF